MSFEAPQNVERPRHHLNDIALAGRFMGKRKDVKKAYVCLKPGQEINFEAEAK